MIHSKNKFLRLFGCLFVLSLAACSHTVERPPRAVVRDGVAITLKDQKLTVLRNGNMVRDYSISSSKFGMGASKGSNRTPLGIHAVTKKTGEGQPKGMVFKGGYPTGEVVAPNSGRDPIVTRVIQLAGLESFNSNSHSRRIYIHGTPEEDNIGRPASYGCIRMRSEDVVDLYPWVYRGMPVAIESCSQATYLKAEKTNTQTIEIPAEIVARLPREVAVPRWRAARKPYRPANRIAQQRTARKKTVAQVRPTKKQG